MDILIRNGWWTSAVKPQSPEASETSRHVLPTAGFTFMPAIQLVITQESGESRRHLDYVLSLPETHSSFLCSLAVCVGFPQYG